jgi:hypothetical protein
MIDDKDIQKLKKEFATKQDLADLTNHVISIEGRVISIEEKMETLATKEDFNNLLTAVDAYAKKADTYFQEMKLL